MFGCSYENNPFHLVPNLYLHKHPCSTPMDPAMKCCSASSSRTSSELDDIMTLLVDFFLLLSSLSTTLETLKESSKHSFRSCFYYTATQ